jgi:isoquinoline 1-oxidoreductase beta subunit
MSTTKPVPAGFSPGRRQFLQQTAAGLSFTFLLATVGGCKREPAADPGSGGSAQPARETYDINAYVNIAADGRITIVSPAAEMGQGVLTTLPLILAEDLDANWDDVVVEPSPPFGDAYGDPLFLNMIFTAASRSVALNYERLRSYGAQARQVLLQNAADKWQVDRSELRTEPSAVIHDQTGRRLTYGEIASFGQVPATLPEISFGELKSPGEFRLIGKDVARRDVAAKASGSALYSIDVSPPGLVYAAIVRAPIEGAQLAAVDDSAAAAMPGVIGILRHEQEVAVVATSYWQALQARKQLAVSWNRVGEVDDFNTELALEQHLAGVRDLAQAGFPWDGEGDIEAGFAAAGEIVEGEYQTNHLYHAHIEPLNAVVWVKEDGQSVEAWVGTQAPPYTVDAIAKTTGLDRAAVRLHRSLLGGAFGRRSVFSMDFVTSAAWLSKELLRPVKVIWDREDDIRYGYFKPMTVQKLRAAVDDAGNIQAWHHRVACEDPLPRHEPLLYEGWGKIPLISMLGAEHHAEDGSPLPHAYHLPVRLVEHVAQDTGIRVYAMRGVGAGPNKFAIESFLDEIAARRQLDPLEFRLQLLQQSPRAQSVLRRLAELARWPEPREGRALGIGYSHYGDSLVAGMAEISVDQSSHEISVHEFWLVADVGIVIQPANTRDQLEGGVIFGLSNCLKENLTIANGVAQQTNFHDYRLLRMREAPVVHVELMPSVERPTGAGEAGTIVAPCAVANAFARLTGKRLRRMPFLPDQVRAALQA